MRANFIGAGKFPAPGQRHSMEPTRSAFGAHEVVIAVVAVEVWPLRAADGRTGEDLFRLAHQRFFLRIVLLEKNAREGIFPGKDFPIVPLHVDQPFSAVLVMKEGGVETAGI